jgi:hypothetical protein
MVSVRLRAFTRREFADADADIAMQRLDALHLALAEKQSLERIQAAVAILARGDLRRLEDNAQLAEKDWRDVLVFSGLGQGDWERRLDVILGNADEEPT